MKYAQILNGVVKNIIVLEDESLVPIFAVGFDSCEPVTEQVHMGHHKIGGKFANLVGPATFSDSDVAGTATTFEPFKLSPESFGFSVFLDGDFVRIGCQAYNYRWLRHALGLVKQGLQAPENLIVKTDTGISYKNEFNILSVDIELMYRALCTLR